MSVNPMESVVPQPPQTGASTAPPAETPLQKKYGGDWAKANAGYFEAANTLSKVQREAQDLAERNKQLEQYVAQQLGVGGSGSTMNPNDPLAAIQTELGLPVEPFRNGIRGEVQVAVAELLAPVLRSVAAEESLASEIDNFGDMKNEARRVMAANPEIAENFKAMQAADPVRAWKYAIREAALARATSSPGAPRSAGLPGSATPQGRSQVNPEGPSPAEREKAGWEYFNQFGDAGPATHERYKGTSIESAIGNVLQRLGLQVPEGVTPSRW